MADELIDDSIFFWDPVPNSPSLIAYSPSVLDLGEEVSILPDLAPFPAQWWFGGVVEDTYSRGGGLEVADDDDSDEEVESSFKPPPPSFWDREYLEILSLFVPSLKTLL